jgi:hypothetical protein
MEKNMNEHNGQGLVTAKERAGIALRAYETKCIEIINSTRSVILQQSGAFNQYHILFDAVDFCVVYDLDIALLRFQVQCAETKWRKNLNARLLAMTIWECVDDLTRILGREFRDAITGLTFSHDLRTKLDKTLKEINGFRGRHESLLKDIRNLTAAHREVVLDKLLAALEKVQPDSLIDLAQSLRRLLSAFYKTMTEILREAKQLIKLTHAMTTLKPS